MEDSDMSFSVSFDKGLGLEWGTRNGLSSLFAQKRNLLNPYFWKMLRELIKFKDDVLVYLDELENKAKMDHNDTLGSFTKSRGYSELFVNAYLIPLCTSLWPCPLPQIMAFSAFTVLSCLCNHHVIQLFGGPQWLRVKGKSHCYINKVMKELVDRGCEIRTNSEVNFVSTSDNGNQATHDERRILGAFQYAYSNIFLHQDESLMPRQPAAWSAWNFLGSSDSQVSLTYWLNVMQNICKGDQPFLATVNPFNVPKNVLLKWSIGHPIPTVAASKASLEIDNIQGKRGIWFCGAYQGYGFHEDGLKAGMVAAHGMLGRNCIVLQKQKEMAISWTETAARSLFSTFLRRFISAGCLIILEDGGRVLTFEGTSKECAPKVAIRVHNPQFYWKVSMEADLGLADAYINGDFSLVNKNEGLLNLFMGLVDTYAFHSRFIIGEIFVS